jgi:2-amino-4-hydroxy-6-hydroxymethyldihydropteridine diphosphokinase
MPLSAPETPVRIGLGLGSNIGDKAANIRRALQLLQQRGHVKITAQSSLYRTAPWGNVAQDFFANACALGETLLSPQALLIEAKAIEEAMGREKSERWGPRLIDVDILFYGAHALDDPALTIPHKELFARAFVLVPLAEIAPDLQLGGRLVRDAAAKMVDQGVEKWAG